MDEGSAPALFDEALGVEALCDDARWVALAETLAASSLGMKLRAAEVLLIGEERIEITPPRPAAFSAEERTTLDEGVRIAFGPAFRLMVRDDITRAARPDHTLRGLREARELARQEALRAEATKDETVTRLRRYFPNSQVLNVNLPDPAKGNENV